MEKELLDKEVLCILDTRQIQRFLFRSNSYRDVIGGSDLLRHLLDDAIRYALQTAEPSLAEWEYDLSQDPEEEIIPFFSDDRCQFQLITCSAGNALCIARTGRLCQHVIRSVSRYYLDHAYSLNVCASVVERTDDLSLDVFNLYKKLNAIKASCSVSNPLGALPISMKEENTGEPVEEIDPETGEGLSRSAMIRREEADKRKDYYDICGITGTDYEGGNYKAVIHADGNNLGISIGKILAGYTDYERGIRVRRQLNRNILSAYHQALEKTLEETEANFRLAYGPDADFSRELQIITQAGDDLNVLCNARTALPFLRFLYGNLKEKYIWNTPELKVPLYVCAGVAFVRGVESFRSNFELAEECCKSAKTVAKLEENLRDGFAGNWIDFELSPNTEALNFDYLRSKAVVGATKLNLYARPYCIDEEAKDEFFSAGLFVRSIEALKGLGLSWETLDELSVSYSLGREYMNRAIQRLKREGVDLPETLGRPYVGSGSNRVAAWYDVIDVLHFVE